MRAVSYYRVSTNKQGVSGLGLEAQRAAVRQYLGGTDPVAEFTEVETGKGSNALSKRPKLQAALATCRAQGATLVIAKLDRLARNVAFVATLIESKTSFVAVDRPNAKAFELHIYAALAEEEARQISARTKAAMAAAKARGVKLGNPRIALLAQERKRMQQGQANRRAADLSHIVEDLRWNGVTTLRDMVAELNARQVPTPRGGRWHLPTLHRALKRMEASKKG